MKPIEKGILGLSILMIMLVVTTGSVSATDITDCTVIESPGYYEITENIINSTATYCINIQSNDVIIDGQEYYLDGVSPGDCEDDYRVGVYNKNHDNVTIKNLEVKNFCTGIYFRGSLHEYVDSCTICNCIIHDNGGFTDEKPGTYGIFWFYNVTNSEIEKCEVYNTTGAVKIPPCESGGMGIQLKKACSHNTIIDNYIHDNLHSGLHTKAACKYNYVANNNIVGNSKIDAGGPSGGITLRCKKSNSWTIESNIILDNYGPGIFVGGNYNIIRDNTVEESKSKTTGDIPEGRGISMGRGDASKHNRLFNNKVCNNEDKDIYNIFGHGAIPPYGNNTGDENCCDTTENHNDEETTGCTYCCGSDLVITDIWIESGKSCIDGKDIEQKELEDFMQEKGMEKEQEELKELIDKLGISTTESIDDKCIWGRKVYYEVANMGCQEWAGWSVSNLTVDGEFKMFDLVRPLAPKQSRVERFWFYRLPSGEHEVEVCADFLGWVSECNETNNCLTKTLGG